MRKPPEGILCTSIGTSSRGKDLRSRSESWHRRPSTILPRRWRKISTGSVTWTTRGPDMSMTPQQMQQMLMLYQQQFPNGQPQTPLSPQQQQMQGLNQAGMGLAAGPGPGAN